MGAPYSLGIQLGGTSVVGPALDHAAPAGGLPKCFEYALNSNGGATPLIGIGRSGNTPVQTNPTYVIPNIPGDDTRGVNRVSAATTWSTAPTVPTPFLRRTSLPTGVGNGVIWTFPRGVTITSTNSLVAWTLTTANVQPYNWSIWNF